MKKSDKTDKICIEKIQSYIGDIGNCFERYEIKSYNDLRGERLAQYAITQILTNIHEVKKKLTDEIVLKLPEFNKIKLAGARNIASHDYERLDFEIIYRRANQLLRENIISEMEGMIDELEDDKPSG